ncbi:TetR/AcrR family transcriptional regulator [Blastococcus goldschmidtiae]|uniref:TetR/AcrR family transcriptional regulator n=1 Tax=Blastococcus goldschmidtiae TaxID=3075546 RepID=A0ABU2KAQ2_9ACTN|nr:TetR/AcrR family transcriptional regulator [Blastococcus sp. DSM 46792]MDT0277257.1 TetR/AcrR family transcriptional regulator [Blastococcus sp. DSM 46792]
MTESAARSRGAYAKTAARRQRIVTAAVEVFAASGYHKGSLRDVAERAGLSQAGLLHHFPSKVHVIQAVVEWHDEQSARVIADAVAGGLDPLGALVVLLEHNERNPELVGLYVLLSAEATAPDHPLHDYFVRRYAGAVARLQARLEGAAGSGRLRPGVDPAGVARALTALMDGLQVQWLYDRGSVDMAAELRRYLAPLLVADP